MAADMNTCYDCHIPIPVPHLICNHCYVRRGPDRLCLICDEPLVDEHGGGTMLWHSGWVSIDGEVGKNCKPPQDPIVAPKDATSHSDIPDW